VSENCKLLGKPRVNGFEKLMGLQSKVTGMPKTEFGCRTKKENKGTLTESW